MEYPKYSEVAIGLLRELGIDIPRLRKDFSFEWLWTEGPLQPTLLFDQGRYGRDVLIRGVTLDGVEPGELAAHVDAFPLPEDARAKLKAFLLSRDDVLADLSPAERKAYLHRTSYPDFLREHFGLPEAATQIFSNAPAGLWGLPAESLSVAECLQSGLPGAHVLGELSGPEAESYFGAVAMFPDGNSSIARLLVRSMIPECFPGMAADADPFGIVTAQLYYGVLDRPGSTVRLRLNSTVVRVANSADGAGVTVDYVNDGRLLRVTAKQAVLACYNAIVPHLVPDLPLSQKSALAQCVKRPMLVVNTLLRNGHALQKLGILGAQLPGSFLQNQFLVTGVNVGDYRPAWKAEDPCVMQAFAGFGTPQPGGLGIAAQNRVARAQLLEMQFEDFEREVRRVLNSLLGPGGFDAARDILAITVNRWPHGYARDHLDLEDPDWNVEPPPEEVGRQRFGNVAIANSDAGADAYTHAAIDQAWRAVKELA
jgi:spermidine dehydrogenase